jgi:hypothetical protein
MSLLDSISSSTRDAGRWGSAAGGWTTADEIASDLRDLPICGGGDCRSAELTGTKALMMAVLEEGIRSYFSLDRRIAEEARQWIGSGRRRSPFAFVVICEMLNLDTGAVRDRLALADGAVTAGRRPVRQARAAALPLHRFSADAG